MKRAFLLLFFSLAVRLMAQVQVDTLAIQDFELVPQSPTWTFTGPVIYNSGFSTGSAAPPNSPIGIGGSRAWETTTNSGGLVLNFANTTIPSGYDSVRVHFNLAAMNLVGTTGGPDDLDYVLVAYSTDGGTTFVNRLRIRGALNNNSFWPYSATGVAKVFYTPASESVFQPTTTGLQTTLGYSNCEIVFPGTVTQVAMRLTGRSSSSTDTWLIDNLLITGEYNCSPSAATLSQTACASYQSPSGNYTWTASGTYMDTIPNSTGCDSVLTINLTVNQASNSTLTAAACGSYTSPSGSQVWTASGTYSDTLTNSIGCDSVISVNLTINQSTSGSLTASGCGSYTSPSGNQVWTASGTYLDTIPNAAGCDSIITASITILQPTQSTLSDTACTSYLSPAGNTYTSSGTYTDVIQNQAGCDSTITLQLWIWNVQAAFSQSGGTLTATPSGAQYQWIDCDNGNAPIPGATGQSFSPTASGNYAVVVTQGGCMDTAQCAVVVGMRGAVNSGMILHPNPTVNQLVVDMPGWLEPMPYTIVDALGRQVASGSLGSSRVAIGVTALKPGVYFLQLRDGTAAKWIKQ